MHYLIEKDGEEPCCVADLAGYEDWTVVAELDEALEDREDIDRESGDLVRDEVTLANQRAGKDHIRDVHQKKYLEALLVKSGVKLKEGFLVQEAAQHSIPLSVLADAVLGKHSASLERERVRQSPQAPTG